MSAQAVPLASSVAGHAFSPVAPVIVIGAERPEDAPAREALLDRAMGAGRRRKSSEALRRGRLPAEGLSLCAKDDRGLIVGTVRLWHVAAGDGGTPALLLGPLAVCPDLEGRGIGAALMRSAIAEAQRQGHRSIVLVGDADYYGRFGFSAGPTGALAMPGPFERHRLLALELCASALAGAGGLIRPTGRRLPIKTAELGRPTKPARTFARTILQSVDIP